MGELYDYYLKHSDLFSEPEKRNIRHIVVKTLEQAEGLRAKLDAVEDFATLAKEHNIDGTKDRGGELGWVTKGVMVPEFEQVAFSLPKGKVSDPAKTPFGWHLIRVEDIQAPMQKGFGEVKKQVKAMADQEVLNSLETRLWDSYQVNIIEKPAEGLPSKQ